VSRWKKQQQELVICKAHDLYPFGAEFFQLGFFFIQSFPV